MLVRGVLSASWTRSITSGPTRQPFSYQMRPSNVAFWINTARTSAMSYRTGSHPLCRRHGNGAPLDYVRRGVNNITALRVFVGWFTAL